MKYFITGIIVLVVGLIVLAVNFKSEPHPSVPSPTVTPEPATPVVDTGSPSIPNSVKLKGEHKKRLVEGKIRWVWFSHYDKPGYYENVCDGNSCKQVLKELPANKAAPAVQSQASNEACCGQSYTYTRRGKGRRGR